MRQISVFAAFNGLGGTMLALDEVGLSVKRCFSSETDKFANQAAQLLFPETLQIGNIICVRQALCWKTSTLKKFFLSKYISEASKKKMSIAMSMRGAFIDIIMGGFPCQAWSLAGKQQGNDDPRGKLVHELIKIWKKLKEINPNLAFMFENVAMKQVFMDYMNKLFRTKPIMINAALVTAQNRKRNYWANWKKTQPKDRGYVLRDILEYTVEDHFYLSDKALEGHARKAKARMGDGSGFGKLNVRSLDDKGSCITARYYKSAITDMVINAAELRPCKLRDTVGKGLCHHIADATDINANESNKRIYADDGKSPTLTTMMGGHREPKVLVQDIKQFYIPYDKWKGTTIEASLEDAKSQEDFQPAAFTERRTEEAKRQRREHRKKYGSDFSPRRGKEMVLRNDGKMNCITATYSMKEHTLIDSNFHYRKLTPKECMRLQGFPPWAIDRLIYSGISNTQLYRMTGNGWAHPVIVHLLNCLLNNGWREYLTPRLALSA